MTLCMTLGMIELKSSRAHIRRLYGAPADPFKMAAFREIRRTMVGAYDSGELVKGEAEATAYERRLLLVPEHNFGLSVGQYLPDLRQDNGNWSNPQVGSNHYCQPISLNKAIHLLFHYFWL